jgi:hypothetical protein
MVLDGQPIGFVGHVVALIWQMRGLVGQRKLDDGIGQSGV